MKLPEVTQFMRELNKRGVCVSSEALTIDEAEVEIIEYLRSKTDA